MSANDRVRYCVSKEEWAWAVMWSLVLSAVCLFPYALGYAVARPDERFIGILGQDIDTNTYFAKIRLGLEGRWWFVDRYTSEPHAPMPFYLPFIWWGLATRVVTRDPAVSYRLAQVVCNTGALLASYAFVSLFFPEKAGRRMAFLLIAMGAGIGWATVPFALAPEHSLSAVDLWMQEATLFASMLSMPHFAAAVALLLVMLRAFWLQMRTWSHWRAPTLLVASALMVLIHPFLALTVIVVASAYSVIGLGLHRISWRPLLLAWLLLLLGVGPAFLVIQGGVWLHPIGRTWVLEQGWMLSPPLYSYILGYGVLFALAVWGSVLFVRRGMDLWPVVWLGTGILLLYVPVSVQRRLLEGLAIPICILAAMAWREVVWPWLARLARFWRSVMWIGLVVSIVLSNVVLWSIACVNALSHSAPWFVTEGEARVWEWLLENGEPDEVVLSSPGIGNRIPAHTNKRVVVGHWAETVQYTKKVGMVERFFDSMTVGSTRMAILKQFDVRYVVQGPAERSLDLEMPGLREVYASDGFVVYYVIGE